MGAEYIAETIVHPEKNLIEKTKKTAQSRDVATACQLIRTKFLDDNSLQAVTRARSWPASGF
jgi:hypothetical protein